MSDAPMSKRNGKKSRSAAILSPLRYPGGKRRLAPYIADVLHLNGIRPKLYVEPFAGGASIAIYLLHNNLVETVALGEKDPMVANFWKAVFQQPEQLIEALHQLKPSLELWEYFRKTQPNTTLDWAIKCLFLNRTSFSGILNETAGPIGGRAQTSAHGIGCRFPVARLTKRIRYISAFADRIAFIDEGDWQNVVSHVQDLDLDHDDVFYYFDPPFYEKADRLYRYYFVEADHQKLYDALGSLKAKYILSYDAAEPIIAKYATHSGGLKHVDLLYSAKAKGGLIKASELIVSNLAILPEHTRLWHSNLPELLEVEIPMATA